MEGKEERLLALEEGFLPIMEHFYTLQGEGAHTGTPAYFIRTGGCDVGCHWCDVKESWDFQKHPPMSVESLAQAAKESGAPIAVVTGGEPLIYNLNALTRALKDVGMQTHIETSGAYPLSGFWDWITLSPKKFKAPVKDFHKEVNELKTVIFHGSDFRFAEQHAALVNDSCALFLQPEWGRQNEMTSLIIDYVKQNPRWRISLQSHKYMQIP